MLRTVQFACTLPQDEADALNAESGRLYTDMVVCHLPLPRLPPQGARASGCLPNGENAGRTLMAARRRLHAHRHDAAQQGFSTACTTANACQAAGLDTQ